MSKTNASAAEVRFIEETIERAYGVPGRWEGSEVVHETWEGKTMWIGEVHIVAIEHAQASRAYAWFYEDDAGKRRVRTVLGAPPVTSAAMAVRAGIVSETPNPAKP
jgi:hypothetical protein